ncbi:MAG: hypothetical protein ABSC94_08105 [Polyangiaceae bacterium]
MPRPATIVFVTRPGIAKARALPLMLERSGLLVRTAEPPWRRLFESADVVSEGSAREENGGRVWYGSTSLVLTVDAGTDRKLLVSMAARNVHLRLRAMRTAHREAALRAPGGLGRFLCEIHISPTASGVRIDVDVQAPLIERRAVHRAP